MAFDYNISLGSLKAGATLQDAQELDKRNLAQGRKTNFVQLFQSMDKDKNGVLSEAEVKNYGIQKLNEALKNQGSTITFSKVQDEAPQKQELPLWAKKLNIPSNGSGATSQIF